MRLLCFAMIMLASMPAFSIIVPEREIRSYCLENKCSNQVFYTYFDSNKSRFCHEKDVLKSDRDKAGMLSYISQRFKDKGLPENLAVVPLLESSMRLHVPSDKGTARGLWQFTSATAKDVGLVVDKHLDERTDLSRSTDAGAAYLSYLIKHFDGDRNLAVMAFNMGLGRLDKMIERHKTRNPWFLSRLISDSRPDKDYLLKFHSYALVLQNKGCST